VGEFGRQSGWQLIFVADLKTPKFEAPDGISVLSVEAQQARQDDFARRLPWRHYARKNLGYIQAIRGGAEVIFDTDDDNAPVLPWRPRPAPGASVTLARPRRWVNVHAHFGAETTWPRGFPLEEVRNEAAMETEPAADENVVVWQGLVEGDPDVDAIYRLTRRDAPEFRAASPLVLPAASYCPFNSQNTWWSRPAFPYLYLPATVTFRFTDILRGLVAQRCFWAHGWRLGFQGVTARQERNAHNLLADFEDEIPCYLWPEKITRRLDALSLSTDAASNLKACYAALAEGGWVKPEELELVKAWLAEVAALVPRTIQLSA